MDKLITLIMKALTALRIVRNPFESDKFWDKSWVVYILWGWIKVEYLDEEDTGVKTYFKIHLFYGLMSFWCTYVRRTECKGYDMCDDYPVDCKTCSDRYYTCPLWNMLLNKIDSVWHSMILKPHPKGCYEQFCNNYAMGMNEEDAHQCTDEWVPTAFGSWYFKLSYKVSFVTRKISYLWVCVIKNKIHSIITDHEVNSAKKKVWKAFKKEGGTQGMVCVTGRDTCDKKNWKEICNNCPGVCELTDDLPF